MSRGRTRLMTAAAFLLLSPAVGTHAIASAHPLHTSLAEVVVDSRSGIVSVSLRVFADDFAKAAARARVPVAEYAARAFRIIDASGAPVRVQSCGERRVGDLMWLCLKARTQHPKSISLHSSVLFDTYKDQINVVQTTVDGKKSSLLFTPGEGAKRLHS